MCSLSVFLEFVLSVSRFLLLRFLYLQDADPSNGIRSKQTFFPKDTTCDQARTLRYAHKLPEAGHHRQTSKRHPRQSQAQNLRPVDDKGPREQRSQSRPFVDGYIVAASCSRSQ